MIPVIAVAAPVGGGKTSLVTAIASALGDAAIISYDNYERSTIKSPDEMRRWMLNGALFDDLPAPGLADDLVRMKRGEAIIDPGTGTSIQAKKLIIFEMPLGREYTATSRFIDYLVWIDTPLDMALARKIKEFIAHLPPGSGERETRAFLSWLGSYIDSYMDIVGKMLDLQRERVPVHADLILDGRNGIEALVLQALEGIHNRFPG
jgi:uridine kinase